MNNFDPTTVCASSETQGQSVRSGEKGRWKFSSTGKRAPGYRLSPNHFQKFKRIDAGSWLGTKNALYYCAQLANSFSWVLFVHSYTTAIVSIRACLGHAQKMHAVRKLSVWYTSPSDFKILSARKLKALFQKYKLQLTTGIHACIGHVLRKYIYRELLKDTTMETSHGKVNAYFFLSFYRDYFNSLTLSNASELLWSWISNNQPYPSSWREWMLSLLVYILHKTWN